MKLLRPPELTEVEQVKAALLQLLAAGNGQALLDMTSLEKISSATIGMAVAVHLRAAESGGRLVIRIRADQKRLFELTMLMDTLNLEFVPGSGTAD
jgi:anti-anti-sigma regulatory factor